MYYFQNTDNEIDCHLFQPISYFTLKEVLIKFNNSILDCVYEL